MSVISTWAIGSLKKAFNEEQEAISRRYTEVEQTLQENKVDKQPKKEWALERLEIVFKSHFKKVLSDFFQRLVLGGMAFGVVYYFFRYVVEMSNEFFPLFFSIVAAVWSTMAYGYSEDEESELFTAGVACIVIMFIGYWMLMLLVKILN